MFIDLNALAAGDIFQFRTYERISGGTQRVVYNAYFAGAQGEPIWTSPALVLIDGWDMTLDRLAGSDRAITWSIRKVA